MPMRQHIKHQLVVHCYCYLGLTFSCFVLHVQNAFCVGSAESLCTKIDFLADFLKNSNFGFDVRWVVIVKSRRDSNVMSFFIFE